MDGGGCARSACLAGYSADIEIQHDSDSLQPGAALALFADRGPADRGTADQETADHGPVVRLGADQAGALRRRAESIGEHAANRLIQEISSRAMLDRFAADQGIPFAALAEGESRFPAVTDHLLTGAWLADVFLGAQMRIDDQRLAITGAAFRATSDRTAG